MKLSSRGATATRLSSGISLTCLEEWRWRRFRKLRGWWMSGCREMRGCRARWWRLRRLRRRGRCLWLECSTLRMSGWWRSRGWGGRGVDLLRNSCNCSNSSTSVWVRLSSNNSSNSSNSISNNSGSRAATTLKLIYFCFGVGPDMWFVDFGLIS